MNNNYELNEHKRSDTVKWIVAFALITVLLVGMVASLILSVNHGKEQPPEERQEETLSNDFAAEVVNTEHIRLAIEFGNDLCGDNSVSKTLTATVLPATATNKFVDWSAEWGDEGKAEDVSQYLTVTPSSNGSTTATVTCKKAFTGNILVTATTRENGYQASCIVTFLGMPTDIAVSTTVAKDGDAYNVGIGIASVFDISLTNPFGSVGSQFNNVSCSVSGVGSIVVGYMEHYNQSGNDKWYDGQDKTITLDSIKDALITASYANGKLTVNSVKSIESYYASSERLDSGRTRAYHDKFRSFVDDCYFKVTINENTSGLTKVINIRFDDAVVTGVNISNAEMSF